jgi:diguanylate cyclase (GGDEF)-like protein/PAS domain S-box-containing protein
MSEELFCVVGQDGIMILPSEGWERFSGYSSGELGSMRFVDLLHRDDRGRIMPAGGGESVTLGVEGRVRCADGVYRVVEWSVFPAPEPGAVYVVGHETVDSGAQESLVAEIGRLHRDIDTLATMRDNLDMCLTMQEASGVIGRFCEQAMDGYPGEVWIANASRNLLERIARWGDGNEGVLATTEPQECWAIRGGRPHSYEPGGSGLPCGHFETPPKRSRCYPLKGAGDALGVLTTWADSDADAKTWSNYLRRVATISEVLAMGLANLSLRQSLRAQSIRDPLTGLFNRRYMEETMDRELARAKRHDSSVGLIMLDVDNFKHFNDEFGHRAGDNALVELGDVLAKLIRAEDVACRYGGEEFAVIMPGAPLEATTRRAVEIGKAVRGIVVQDSVGALLSGLSASLGVAVFPDHGDTCDVLVKAADLALFAAKQAGRDCVRVAEIVDSPLEPPPPTGETP